MDPISWDGLKARDQIIKLSEVDLTKDYFVLGHYNNRRSEFQTTDYPLYLIKAADVLGVGALYDNPFDFYVDAAAPPGGDGTFDRPFTTITELNNAVLLEDPTKAYTGIFAPHEPGYGAEVIGALTIAPNLSLIGITPQNTGIICDINLIATANPNGIVNQYRNVAFNGIFTMDLTLATFASISFQNGAVNLNRIDNNLSAFVSLQGGIGTSTISGTVIFNSGVIFGDMFVQPGSTVYVTTLLMITGIFKLVGNCTLKTLSILNPVNGYVDGTVDGSGTPVWLTDKSSDATYTGTLTKTIY
jgi:hypothetical protein